MGYGGKGQRVSGNSKGKGALIGHQYADEHAVGYHSEFEYSDRMTHFHQEAASPPYLAAIAEAVDPPRDRAESDVRSLARRRTEDGARLDLDQDGSYDSNVWRPMDSMVQLLLVFV